METTKTIEIVRESDVTEEFKNWVEDQYDAYEKFKGFYGPNTEANK